jgi:hypothetical protein
MLKPHKIQYILLDRGFITITKYSTTESFFSFIVNFEGGVLAYAAPPKKDLYWLFAREAMAVAIHR